MKWQILEKCIIQHKLQNNSPQHLLESWQKFALLCGVWELIIGPFNALLLIYAVHSNTIFYFLSW